MKFIIFHGSFANAEGIWFPELKENLESLGQKVIVPQFPIDNWNEVTKAGSNFLPRHQNLTNWMQIFDEIYHDFKKNETLCFVGHSLGSLFILHVVARYKIKLDSAIFVSPFLGYLGKAWQIDLVNKAFYKTDFNFEELKKLIPISYVLYSDNDPYVDNQYSLDFTKKLDSSPIFVKGAGHMNMEVNLNEFPLIYELCKSRLDLSLYQRYLAHRRELYAVDYMKGKSEEIIYLDPKEVFAEGVFHFRNLRKDGFCTFYTALKFWDTESKYYQEARKAAKRVRKLIRVFIIDKISDLHRSRLKRQIHLDILAGIKVYLCMFEDIEDIVPEPDFGIWDEDYLCVVLFGKDKNVKKIKLSSRKKDIEEAFKWKKAILKKATRIHNTEKDIQSFIKNQQIG